MNIDARRGFLKRTAALGALLGLAPLAQAQDAKKYVCETTSVSETGEKIVVNFHSVNDATAKWIVRLPIMEELVAPFAEVATDAAVVFEFDFSIGEALGSNIVPGWNVIKAGIWIEGLTLKSMVEDSFSLRFLMGSGSRPYFNEISEVKVFRNADGSLQKARTSVSTSNSIAENRQLSRYQAGKMLTDVIAKVSGQTPRYLVIKHAKRNSDNDVLISAVTLYGRQTRETLAQNFDKLQAVNLDKLKADQCREASCFLTTATVGALGLEDDCWELETLRKFRDKILLPSSSGQALVADYYRIAPTIVSIVSKRDDANRIWKQIYVRYILPSAVLAKLGLSGLARRHYSKMVRSLEIFCGA